MRKRILFGYFTPSNITAPDWILSSGLWDDEQTWNDRGFWKETPKEETDFWDDETYFDYDSIE